MPVNEMLRDLSVRWPWLHRQPIGVTRTGIAAFALACVAIFVGFFAIGRATVPANTPQLQASTGLTLTYTGATVPASLSGVPSIATIDFAPAQVHAASHARATTAAPSPTPASQTTAPPKTTAPPATEAPSTVTPVAAPTPAPSAPASSPRHHSGGSVSFDSSG